MQLQTALTQKQNKEEELEAVIADRNLQLWELERKMEPFKDQIDKFDKQRKQDYNEKLALERQKKSRSSGDSRVINMLRTHFVHRRVH